MYNCRICSQELVDVIDYGQMPIANGFIKNLDDKEYLFNLAAYFCPQCYMVQIGETVKPEMMFHDHYQFVSSTSGAMAKHFEEQADHIAELVKNKPDPFIVELGSNDGIMLRHIAKRKIHHLGIEPSKNVAEMSEKVGVKVLTEFFNEETAHNIVKEHGNADILCGSNVTCHIEDLNSVAAGAAILLKDDGMWFFEDPYIYDIVQKSSFDQMYDEHVFYFSGLSVANMAKQHGMQLVDMEHQDVHGGSMRYYIKKGTNNQVSDRVTDYLAKEKELKLDKEEGYQQFRDNVNKVCKDLKNVLTKLKKEGESVAAYGATSKSTTLLNYAGIGPDLIEYISDNTPTKIGMYTPGTHIPVKSHDVFQQNPPDYTVLLAWNHQNEIMKKEANYRKNGGKFITFFPKVTIQ